MRKIIFLAIAATLMLQGCKTNPVTPVAAAKPVVDVKKEIKQVELDPMKIMTDPNIGNCTACHAILADSRVVAGDIGPPFVDMKVRFPDIKKLNVAIQDQRAISPNTIMPPFGRNKILTPEQIDAVTQYIYQY